ncbi:MAG: DsbC family protein [Motiliproteus sp.]
MMRFSTLLVPAFALLLSSFVQAAGDYEHIRSKIASVVGQVSIVDIHPSGIPSLLEVEFANGQVVYASEDASYILDGTLYQIQGDRAVNIRKERVEAKLQPVRQEAISRLANEDMVVFSPQGEVRATIYAFTDVDCGYCRKLHSEIQAYNQLGIEIRYLAFPRAGVGSNSYDKMVAIWCADDRQQAMTDSKAGRSIEMRTCDNPVADQYALGSRLGVTGTPSLITVDGQIMPGYMPAPRLAAALQLN